jgi:hypothetical protein
MVRTDAPLSPHFSFYELTVTSQTALQDANRDVTDDEYRKLGLLAQFAEGIRHLCGDRPTRIHSGRRAPAVNAGTQGSSDTSQHLRCEALDFDVIGLTVEEVFNILLQAAREGRFSYGQLIIEQADRGYKNADGTEAVSCWVHASVVGTLDPAKVGLAERAVWSEDEHRFLYTFVDRVRIP